MNNEKHSPIEPEGLPDQKEELIGKIIAAQIGLPDQVDIIQNHMEEYFKRFPSYKSKFNDLEWYHIYLDFLDKIPIPPSQQPVKDEGSSIIAIPIEPKPKEGMKNINYYVRNIDSLLNDAADILSEKDFFDLCYDVRDSCDIRLNGETIKNMK